MATELRTPTGTAHIGAAPVGRNAETGGRVIAHRFVLRATDKFGVEHTTPIIIPQDNGVSDAEVEDMLGHAAENFIREVREKYDKRPATDEEKKQIGKALNNLLQNANKRMQSTNGKIYYSGIR